jgi:hypothetical protein
MGKRGSLWFAPTGAGGEVLPGTFSSSEPRPHHDAACVDAVIASDLILSPDVRVLRMPGVLRPRLLDAASDALLLDL